MHPEKLVIASHNAGKYRELSEILAESSYRIVSASEMGCAMPAETANNFQDNAILKARSIAEQTGLPALADDSGLVIPALDGAPGVLSARWAGENRDFQHAIARVRKTLIEGRHPLNAEAYFVCALAIILPERFVLCTEGRVYGTLAWPPQGEHGFGYDPIFMPSGAKLRFAEMRAQEKSMYSHRTRAFERLKEFWPPLAGGAPTANGLSKKKNVLLQK